MFIRPRRYRMIMAFLLGLAVSVALLTGGYFYYRSNIAGIEAEMKTQIRAVIQAEFDESHPMEVVYVFANDRQAGDTISDMDLAPAEVSSDTVPADAVTSPDQALGKVMRCGITKNTIVSGSMFFIEGDYPDDLRVMEYTVVNLPTKLEAGSFIDVRIMFPNGLDYIVLTKKEVTDQLKSDNGQAILWLHVNEEEILRMSSAIVDASMVEGSKLYAVSYVAPDIQKEAVKTYPANNEVLELILANPNIVGKAVEELEARNRAAFEEKMDRDLENAGKNGVYGPIDENAVPAEAVSGNDKTITEPGPEETQPVAEPAPTDDASLDDRL